MPHWNSRPHRRLLGCISRLLRHSPSTEELSSVVRATFRLLSIVIFAAAPPLPRIRRHARHTALCSTTRGLKSEARWAPRVTGAGTEPRPAKSRGNWRMTKQSVSVQAWSEHASPARSYPSNTLHKKNVCLSAVTYYRLLALVFISLIAAILISQAMIILKQLVYLGTMGYWDLVLKC